MAYKRYTGRYHKRKPPQTGSMGSGCLAALIVTIGYGLWELIRNQTDKHSR